MRHTVVCLLVGLVSMFAAAKSTSAEPPVVSHPPLRTIPPLTLRPLPSGRTFIVDAARGNDQNSGTEASPWKTIRHAVENLKAGDTVCLRGGVYYENVNVRLAGTKDGPITIRSFPGEQAILDGGIEEFAARPAEAWEPATKGGAGEFQSRKAYPNLRDVVGAFGDSLIGLHTYHHSQDLRAENELADQNGTDPKTSDTKPLYCGPGLWYDRESGRIHVRLAHTHLPAGMTNYQGETDPRKLPLVVAPFRSTPLRLDGARYVRVQDLVIRGGGHDTLVIEQCQDVELDNVTLFCGCYGLHAMGAQRLKITRCGFHGSVPPWCFRFDTGLNSYPGRPNRDIARYTTHALLVTEAGRESSVFYFPQNDDWEISYCDFTDAHDGLYLGGIQMRFHHNRVTNMQDDGVYLSPMYVRSGMLPKANVHLFQNYFGGCLTALAFGGLEPTTDNVYLYRNVFDLRPPVLTGRPTTASPKAGFSAGKLIGDHGSPPWSTRYSYHNTFVMAEPARSADMDLVGVSIPSRPSHAFNNLFVHLARLPAARMLEPESGVASDGNLYWQPGLDANEGEKFFARYRSSPLFEQSKKVHANGFESRSLVSDPKFVKLANDAKTDNDYRLADGSLAVDAGVDVSKDWPDPLRGNDSGRPDLGALPRGSEPFQAGRLAR